MLVDVEDVKFLFKINDIELILTDEEIEKLIQLELDSILSELGIDLEPEIHEYITYHRHPFKPIVLPLPNVIGIESVQVNHHWLEPHMYHLDKQTGIVKINLWHPLHVVKIYYITQTSAKIFHLLKPLLLDSILYNQLPDDNSHKWLKTITEGDVTTTYDRTKSLAYKLNDKIDSQKKRIKELLYDDRVFMI